MTSELTKEQALAISRNPERSVGDAKRVLEWAAAEPAPEKVPFLLLLNSDAFAAVNTIYGALADVIFRGAQTDQTALWDCLERDWNLDRIQIAADVLLKLPRIDTERLIRLARNRAGHYVWPQIEAWASSTGFALPLDIVEQQEKWKRELSAGGVAENVYADLAKRKAFWPAEADLAPPQSQPPARRSPGYGEGNTELTVDLNRILTSLGSLGTKQADSLQPGLTANEIAARTGGLPFLLPAEAYELYRWRNGSLQADLFPLFWFLPLDDAVASYKSTVRDAAAIAASWGADASFTEKWFPLFDCNGSEALCLFCSDEEAATAPLISHEYESGTRKVAESLTAFIRNIAERHNAGMYFLNEHGVLVERG
jgi:hypothetical protein